MEDTIILRSVLDFREHEICLKDSKNRNVSDLIKLVRHFLIQN